MVETIRRYLGRQRPSMFRLLKSLVQIQSGSHNKAGVDRVSRRIAAALEKIDVTCSFIEEKTLGNHLVVRSAARKARGKQVLLVGHMDTVFPKNTPFRYYSEDGAYGYGPGVADMKGGLVAGIFALKALDAAGLLKKIPICFFINSDEEIGSIGSRPHIEAEARESRFAFVLESGGLNGEIVTARKGNITFQLDIHGKAGHAAYAGADKASAVKVLAKKILEFEALNDLPKGITANVGIIKGGIGPNTVPDYAGAKIDMRFSRHEDKARLLDQIAQAAGKSDVPGTRVAYEILSSRSPMISSHKTGRLFEMVRQSADSFGVFVKEEFRPGCSDANFIAAQDIPVVDGLGPVGGCDHSEKEYIVKKSLLERTVLLALSIANGWRRYSG